jgi:hypothetical protein
MQPDLSSAGITAEMAAHRARTLLLHNSRLACWMTFVVAIVSVFLGICMMLMAISLLMPLSAISFMRVLAALQWGLGGAMFCLTSPALCKWCLRMLHSKVKLDEKGADFLLGTSKKPDELFMRWEQITRIEQKRVGNAQQFTVCGRDGSYAEFDTYTFFRPGHVARMIAERAGLSVQKV